MKKLFTTYFLFCGFFIYGIIKIQFNFVKFREKQMCMHEVIKRRMFYVLEGFINCCN